MIQSDTFICPPLRLIHDQYTEFVPYDSSLKNMAINDQANIRIKWICFLYVQMACEIFNFLISLMQYEVLILSFEADFLFQIRQKKEQFFYKKNE